MSGTVIIDGQGADDAAKGLEERNKGLIFKNFGLFIDCKSETNNTQVDLGKDLDVVMLMDNLIEYSNNYLKNIKKFSAILKK